MAQLPLFGRAKNDKGPFKLGVGSCVWALVDPSDTRTPTDPGFRCAKGWRQAKIHAYGPPFRRVWVKLYRTIGGQDLEVASRVCVSKTKPKSNRNGMTAAAFVRRAGGKMGKYQLASCRR